MKAVMTWMGCILVVALCALAATGRGQEGKADPFDAAKLVGTWKYLAGEKKGEKVEEARLKGQTVTITREAITLKGEAGKFVMMYDLDTKKKPVTIKMVMTESPFGAGAKAVGIIELKGDQMRFCYAPDSDEAPK